MDLGKINKKLQNFEETLRRDDMGAIALRNYLTIYRYILEAEQMPEEELIRRAKIIKPLVRLLKNGKRREYGNPKPTDKLVFIKPYDISQSYLYAFEKCWIEPLEMPDLEIITSFTCYHKYGGYYGFLRPGVDEVLSQIPSSVDLNQVHAFEITVETLDCGTVYDSVLDRHVTKVILYKMKGGLPQEIAEQKVICNGKEY